MNQAEIDKKKLERKTSNAISNLYIDLSTDLSVKADEYMGFNTNISPQAKQVALNQIRQDIKQRFKEIESKQSDIITKSAKESGENTMLYINQLMFRAGLNMSGSYPQLVDKSVNNVITGKAYKKDWNLYRALRKNTNQVVLDADRIIQWGLDENKSIYDIITDLSAYVNPTEKSNFKVTKKRKIAAYAQRIARTVIQHVYQFVTRGACKNNPYIQAFRWTSAGAPTTCEVCAERDGMLFPIGLEPLDHPNGLCWLELVTMPLDEFQEKVQRWSEGQYNEVEFYIRDAFGYNNKNARNVASSHRMMQHF